MVLVGLLAAYTAASCSSSSTADPPLPDDENKPLSDGGPGGSNDGPRDGSVADATSNLPPPTGPLAVAERVEQARYTSDITFVAQPRAPGTPHWQAVQDLCATRFESYGFAVERHKYATGVNVIGVKQGTTDATKRVVVGGHYDSVPDCPGADDNASAVAGVLEIARVLSSVSYPKTLVVACWDEEEKGLIGSKAHAKRAKDAKEEIEAVFDLEMIAYKNDAENTQNMPTGFGIFFPEATKFNDENKKRANFIGAGGDPNSAKAVGVLKDYATKINLPFMSLVLSSGDMNNPLLADLKRSDHAAFWGSGYPAMMITDTSNFRYSAYHCMNSQVDELKNLDLGFATQVTKMIAGAAAETLGFARDF